MTLPSSGTITLQDIATELGVGLPLDLNAANVRALAGVPSGSIIMPNHFWGKSSFAVNFTIGGQLDVAAGSPTSGNRRIYRPLTSTVTGGSGSYTYAWSVTGASYSNLRTPTAANCDFQQSYNTNDFDGPYADAGDITLTLTDTTTGKVTSVTKHVTLG